MIYSSNREKERAEMTSGATITFELLYRQAVAGSWGKNHTCEVTVLKL